MNRLVAIVLALTLFSCEKICSVTSALCNDQIKEEEVIDFTQVDQYPKFVNCDELLNFNESKNCFENSIHRLISKQIQGLELISNENITDTLQIQFTIDKQGIFFCNNIISSDSLKIKLPELSSEIQKIIMGLPTVEPAQKRGIPVTSTYTIPVAIDTE